MRDLINKLKSGLKKYRREIFTFWKYAIRSKIHMGKYKSNKVIMFRLDLIGDCTMFTSAAYAIRKFFSDREMTIVCLSISRPIFERMGVFDRIIEVEFRPHMIDYDKLKTLIEQIRDDKYDILLQPQVSKYPLADILAAATRCNTRIAIETKPGNSGANWIKMVNGFYDRIIEIPHKIVSEFDYYGAFVRGLGNTEYKTTPPKLPYNEQHFVEGDYYVLYPGGSLTQKFWPADRFAMVANHIYERTGLDGVILGVESERWVSEEVKKKLTPQAAMAMIDLTGRTSIYDVIDIIGNAKFVVSNDTSGVHIACATNTPSVSNAGGWHFKRFLPYHIENVKKTDHLPLVAYTRMPCYYCTWVWDIVGRRNSECLRRLQCGEPSECIEKVTYEQVRDLVDQIIKEEKLGL